MSEEELATAEALFTRPHTKGGYHPCRLHFTKERLFGSSTSERRDSGSAKWISTFSVRYSDITELWLGRFIKVRELGIRFRTAKTHWWNSTGRQGFVILKEEEFVRLQSLLPSLLPQSVKLRLPD